jgi:hypothetical protein
MIARPLTALFAMLLLPLALIAQSAAPPTTTPPPVTSEVPSGITVRDAAGKEILVGPGGSATVKHKGKLSRVEGEPNLRMVESIEEVTVRSGGCNTLGLKGDVKATIHRSGTTVNTNGINPPAQTDGADITIEGDNVTVNATGTNTDIRCTRNAQGTTVNTGAGSSGSITYPGAAGYSGSVNFGAGSGAWTMGPAS